MIDLQNRTITIQNKTETIAEWVVWFVTLEGTFNTWELATKSAEKMNQPINTIIPIPVALSDNLYEPYLNQAVEL